jgi:hypothetical protein
MTVSTHSYLLVAAVTACSFSATELGLCGETSDKFRSLLPHPKARQPLMGLLVVEASRSHSDIPYSVGLLWKSDQPVAETST